jgi:hypothetical protein
MHHPTTATLPQLATHRNRTTEPIPGRLAGGLIGESTSFTVLLMTTNPKERKQRRNEKPVRARIVPTASGA